ncbi:cyclin-domain-containing protein, partial [Pilobolus umbonatus]
MPHSLSESQLYTYKSTWDNETHAFPPASTHLVSGAPSVTVERPPSSNRLAYVDALVDANALVIESIWKTVQNNNMITRSASVVPLRTFIQEVLKRSKTTYSTLQTALFYLFRSRPEIVSHLQRIQSCNHGWEDAYISCGRRMFLASLVVASKFVQDKTYRNSAWAKIAGLPVAEINVAERIFLNIIDYRLYISQPTFEQWHHLLHRHVEAKTRNLPTNLNDLS